MSDHPSLRADFRDHRVPARGQHRCGYVVRRAGENSDGTASGPGYGGDVPTYCGAPGTEIRRGGDRPYVVVRCPEHAAY